MEFIVNQRSKTNAIGEDEHHDRLKGNKNHVVVNNALCVPHHQIF